MGNGKEEGWDPGDWEGKGSGKIRSLKTREGRTGMVDQNGVSGAGKEGQG